MIPTASKELWHLDFLRAFEAGYSLSMARMYALGAAVKRGETRTPETAHSDKQPLRKSSVRQHPYKCIQHRSARVVMPKDFPTVAEFTRHLKEQIGLDAFQAMARKQRVAA